MKLLQYSDIGLGCACNQLGVVCSCNQLGVVAAYDVITIAGKLYSANQIVDKQLVASRDVKVYRGGDFNTPFATIKAGQPIGKVYSYIKATQSTGIRAGGPLLQFLDTSGRSYYVKDDNAISTAALKDQGTLTLKEELKEEQAKIEKDSDPISFYVKKLAMPVIIGAGVIYLVATFGKEFIKSKLAK